MSTRMFNEETDRLCVCVDVFVRLKFQTFPRPKHESSIVRTNSGFEPRATVCVLRLQAKQAFCSQVHRETGVGVRGPLIRRLHSFLPIITLMIRWNLKF